MTNQQRSQSDKAVRLAELLCGKLIDQVPVSCNQLINGIDIELQRLGSRKYLVVRRWVRSMDRGVENLGE